MTDEESKQAAQVKRLIHVFWTVETVLLITCIQQMLIGSWEQGSVLLTFAAILFYVLVLAKKGKIQQGGDCLLLMLTILLLGFVWRYNGLRDEVLMVFPGVIMVSLLMGSQRFSIYLYLLVCTNILAIGYLNEYGYVQHSVKSSNINTAILLTIIFTFISYIAWLLSSEMKKTNQALRESKAKLEQRVKERTAELEQSLENLTNTQNQLVETEKMASLGRLVAGVAHEINTPIGIAITASSYLEDMTKDFMQQYDNNNISKKMLAKQIETTTRSSKLIRTNLERAADLVQGFKEVAVDQSNEEVRKFNLKHYLGEILASLHPKIKSSNCHVQLDCDDNINLNTSPGALAQIITNLVINSITHGFENEKNGYISIDIIKENDFIQLIYADSGSGISPENLIKLFEPFFTTKRGKGGSGLGMHIVYNLVNQSLHGSIKCTSTLGKGTSFFIRFPCDIATTSS